jgi:hypothetical protein
MTRTSVSNSPSSLSSFLHGAVDLFDDNDENDETLYRVSRRWNDNGDDDEIENMNWDAMLARAHERAGAVRRSYQRTPAVGQNEMLPEEVLPQKLLLHPHDGDKSIWRL